MVPVFAFPRAAKKIIWEFRSLPIASFTAWMAMALLPTAWMSRSIAAWLLKRRVMYSASVVFSVTPRPSMRVVSPSKAAVSSNTAPKTLLMVSFWFATFALKLKPPEGKAQAVSVLEALKRSTPVSTKLGTQVQL